ncbi:ribosomal protein S3 (mitochondrion) [Naegleria fowleri]|uniref:Ribosomal protein S3 n=1 Tax=Naegleria fowleri TaxID=5763 RepID=M4H5R4_NAEFO|nr:ribosomal protein S3 [Naegleria fowleri]AFP72316.1 ribosomal protein S3 [Naegleria fowleri]AOS85608.1 ribosomal protein S3 [Naegleria fowleri]AOS85654.1 ribosomal protein S3 [Naegleria fowleri]UAT97084.1 ribosomal protein S3 [Naegleria fowleri]WND64454.1 hypothetical protein HHPHBPLO_00034 [Naegleria fowleri]
MSRISNLSNLRVPFFNSWKNTWYEDSKYYSLLFFRDFQVLQYFKGLFYRLKMLTDDVYLNYITNNYLFVNLNIYLYRFQIKKYFLSFFSEQYLLYSFMFRKNKIHKVNLRCNRVMYVHAFYSNSVLYFLYFFNRGINKRCIHKKYFYSSIININNRPKYKNNPIKFQLKKNIFYFFSFYRKKKKNNLKLLSLFYYVLRFFLFLSIKLTPSFILFRFFLLCYNKLLFLKQNFVYSMQYYPNKVLNHSYYFLKENYKRELSRDIFDERTFYDFFVYFFLYYFILNIEKTIYLFTGMRFIFLGSFYMYKKLPPLLSSKLVNDYVCLELEKGANLFRIFKSLQYIQLREKRKLKTELLNNFSKSFFEYYFIKRHSKIKQCFALLKRLNILSRKNKKKTSRKELYLNLNKSNFFLSFTKLRFLFDSLCQNEIMAKKYPLIGLRIECNGPPKKGRQARLVAYHQIIKNYKLFGKMPNKSILADIDYYQSFARAKQGSIGIKVWMFFYSKTYDSNYKLISIV